MKRFEIYKAVDKIDGELSLFMFDARLNYTVVDYSKRALGCLIEAANNGTGCHWNNDPKSPRFDDMINPVLLCAIDK